MYQRLYLFAISWTLYQPRECAVVPITVGAVLSSSEQQTVFWEYVEQLNLKYDHYGYVRFNSTSVIMEPNPIKSAQVICRDLIPQKVNVIIVSHPPNSDNPPISVSYTCGFYQVPVIGIFARDSAFSDKNVHPTFIRTVPPFNHQAVVWVKMLLHFDWKKVVLIHGMDEEGRTMLSNFQAQAVPASIKIEKVLKYSTGIEDFTSILQELTNVQSRIVLLSASKRDAEQIFLNAANLNLTNSDYVWLVSERALEASTVPIGTIGLELTNRSNEQAHLEDSVNIIGNAFHKLFENNNLTDIGKMPQGCSDNYQWENGKIIFDALKNEVLENGKTGRVSFDSNGDRQDPIYWIKNVQPEKGLVEIGIYRRESIHGEQLQFGTKPIVWPSLSKEKPKGIKISTHLQIVTIEAKPFVYTKKAETEQKCRNDTLEIPCIFTDQKTGEKTTFCCYGYCIDMLFALIEKINFTFDLHLSKDNSFGIFTKKNNSKTKEWNGMMGELVRGETDLIVAPLTIDPERAEHIEFSKPFKYQGLTILVKKSQKDSSLASFLQPFQDTLWILVGLSVHVVALVLYLLDRFSPFGRFKMAKSEETEEDALNLSSAMWFAWGVLLNSGIGEGTPRSFSARVLGMVWAGFAMIIVASYTANLAAFLVLDRPDAKISGIDDARLRNPNENFKYATVKNSAVEMYFKRQVELSTMYRKMEDLNYKTAEEAIEAVKSGRLQAFIWDSSRLEYEAANECDLMVAGELFGRSGMGIGLQKGSPWTQQVSLAILELHEGGQMEQFDNKWILVESTACPERGQTPATLGLTNMAGVFMMVAGGIVAGVILIFIEILYKRHRGLKEKELELARNAADRWRGNIAKRKYLRETWPIMRALTESVTPDHK
ncbi:hypothetical protein CHS0354_032241 [Potamilus streckersoni]|uniref:Glutamate [NMDA] receptor subunit 1 n=1 Tax=Potamilus streckersoni TaxID=2493646 RepID=A0AAE0VGH5_9BIVA|nr:hypothetical protein CHS0354_032241 [Potamilus streckersoni]